MNPIHLVGQFLASPWAIIAGMLLSAFLLVVLLAVLSACYQQWQMSKW